MGRRIGILESLELNKLSKREVVLVLLKSFSTLVPLCVGVLF